MHTDWFWKINFFKTNEKTKIVFADYKNIRIKLSIRIKGVSRCSECLAVISFVDLK